MRFSEMPTVEERNRQETAAHQWELQFLKSPHEIMLDNDKVTGIRLEKNELVLVSGVTFLDLQNMVF